MHVSPRGIGRRDSRLGVYLVVTMTAGWLVLMVSLQFWQASQHDYGSGFGDGGRLPPEVVEDAGGSTVASDRQAVVDVVSRPGSDGGLFNDAWRIAVTLVVLAGTVWVWYVVMSRVGTF